jgi:hypothetical protein
MTYGPAAGNDELARLLDRAAIIVDRMPLLAQGAYELEARTIGGAPEDGRTCYCTVGAIQAAIPTWGQRRKQAYAAVCRHLADHPDLPARYGDADSDVALMNWNDETRRTKDEVAQAFRGAAEMLRAEVEA